MKGACAIAIDDGKVFFSFGLLKKPAFLFIEEFSITISQKSADLFSSIKDNAEMINRTIDNVAKRHNLKIDKVFLELPQSFINTKIVTDIVPLRGKRKVSFSDIKLIKKYLEDKFLDWDDYCIHNIGLQFTTRGATYQEPPYGVWAKKLAVKSLLVSIKDKVYKELEDIFDNFGRQFLGLVSSMVSTYANVFTKPDKPQVVMYCGYQQSSFVVRKKGDFVFSEEVNFNLKSLIDKLAKRFFLDFALAEELFERYISFKEIPYFKEITIKKGTGYANLSIQTMNLFMKDYIKSEVENLFQLINLHTDGEEFIFSFLGQLGNKDGFYKFLRGCVSCELATSLERSVQSTSFGCLRYGLSPFLELDYRKNKSFLQRAVSIYREYF
ncbi:MAG: hypothetical protein K9L86_07770 [Candidatus Omnitrophica bacterium]|nr:hypothetical protein [Candidatus Omnitrophota bacterium]